MSGGRAAVRPLRHVPAGSETEVAALYREAFGRRLGPALGPGRKGRAFVAAHLHHDRGVTALDASGRVIGIAGFQVGGRGPVGGGFRDVSRMYGVLPGLIRVAVLALFERRQAQGEPVMDSIAVDSAHRGEGIGSILLDEVASVAAEHGCHLLGLDVIDVNPRARALYERHGFTAVRTCRTPYLRRLLGFGAVTAMTRQIPVPGRPATDGGAQ
ncbi:GNAT family N-acetyltransferase [Embleya sp. NPDC008237]|uniref:GNAT family N-acetyltransferase n=1 Tax=Embleya sp. NPDC008237 TaxID=3363978 RepID=UPI0036E75804